MKMNKDDRRLLVQMLMIIIFNIIVTMSSAVTMWPYSSKVPAPWGWYNAQLFNAATNTLPDATGNGNDAYTSGNVQYGSGSSNGAAAYVFYITGDTTGTVSWPTGSIETTFTICSVSRYIQNAGANFRILQGKSTNWVHGHWSNHRGVGSYGGTWLTALDSNRYPVSVNILTNWLIMCSKNSGTYPKNVLIDGITAGVTSGVAEAVTP